MSHISVKGSVNGVADDGVGGTNQLGDIFSVYLQRPGDAQRTLVFSNFYSDRNFLNPDVGLDGRAPISPRFS